MKPKRPRFTDLLRKQWFLLGILTCIVLAAVKPQFGTKGGPLKPEYTVKYGAISLIFFVSGLSLETKSFIYTLKQYKLHVFVQAFTFVLIPVAVRVLVRFLSTFDVNPWVLKGLVTVACMPPPVSSAVILTRAAHGNEAAAIFNSVLGSFLGIVITPLSLLVHLGFTTLVPLTGTIVQLAFTVLLPLLVGHAIKKYSTFRGSALPLNITGQMCLLYIIYTTFCDAFVTREVELSAIDVLVTIFLVLIIQIILLGMSYTIATHFKRQFTPSDVVAIVFCCTHKSLTLGIPILRIMFHGFSHLSHISLPLLIYHPTQIILGGLLVAGLKDWVQKRERKRIPI